jgi:3-phenylpropionate/cinnamic acid dioxygenase small subunit
VTCHLVGNVTVVGGTDGTLEVTANLIVAEVRRVTQNVHAGRVEHHLVPRGDDFRIRRKVIWLLNGDAPLGNVTFLIWASNREATIRPSTEGEWFI